MKSIKYIFILIVMSCVSSCNTDDTTTNTNQNQDHDPTAFAENFGNAISRDFIGTVVDMNNNPLINVSIRIGNVLRMTDINGVFIITNAPVNERFAYIKAEKAGYIHASRVIVPSVGTNKVRIMMLPETVAGTTSSGIQETINLPNGASVALEGDYIKPDGTAYSGSVNVIMHHLDPVDENMPYQMPGTLYAANANNEEQMLKTFGMLAVELRGESGEDLNLAEGSTAEITIPFDPSLMANAPSTIPLWYFDETNGYWIEDGEATLIGSAYVGTVSHFSFWNCDIPTGAVTFCTTITDSDTNPLDNLIVKITSSTYGTTSGITNENGEVCGYIPSNETLELNVYSPNICITEPLYSGTIGPFTSDSSLDITSINLSNTELVAETISGTFLTCFGDSVSNGYVKIIHGDQVSINQVTNGSFDINVLRCSDVTAFELEAVDYDNLEMAEPQTISFTTPQTNLGILQACSEINVEFIQYQFGNNALTTRPVSFAGIAATGIFQITYISEFFGASSFTLRINNYTVPGDYPGDLGQGDFSSDIPFSEIRLAPYLEFEGTTTVTNFGTVGEFITVTFSGIIRNSNINQEFTLSGEIQAIRDQ